jgi:hypothetical protein
MYDKFFLSKDQLNTINNCSLNDILFIYGDGGIGKTELAKEIFKKKVITIIDSLSLKNKTDIHDYLLNIIKKKNITMMFDKSKRLDRGIIIDNLEIFHKHDKKIYKSILSILSTYKFYETRIIVICSSKFIKHRSLNKIKFKKLCLSYDKHNFHKILNNILKDENKSLTFDQKEKYIKNSNNNINILKSYIDEKNKEINIFDNYDTHEILTKKLIMNKFTIEDISRLFVNEKITISLNLIENIYTYTKNLNEISDIYNDYVNGDIIDTTTLNYNIEDYYTIFTIYKFNLILRKYKIDMYYPIKNNNYISRLTILIYNEKISNTFKINRSIIYPYLYSFNLNLKISFIYDKLKNIDKKELEYFIKSFNYFYKSKVNIKKINNYKLL